MRMRIISTAIILGLGVVGIALAQQGKGEEPPKVRAKLRSEVAKLRAEVEALELEHAIDADLLKKGMTDLKNLDQLESGRGPIDQALKEMLEKRPDLSKEALASVREKMSEADLVNEVTVKVGRPIVDRMRKEFVRKSTELNEKRLELAEVETRYNGSR